jgi:ACS family tartrate transporter-like MFS transporter
MDIGTTAPGPLEQATIMRAKWRMIPLLFLCLYAAFLDRVNVGFAALQMNKALGLTAAAFGFGSGIFFFGYFLAEIPSNLILERIGARVWIARILVTWGVISGLTAFVWNEWSFYTIRFLIGVAEGLRSRRPTVPHLVVPVRLSLTHDRLVHNVAPGCHHDRLRGVRVYP